MRALLLILLVACGAGGFQRNPGTRVQSIADAPSGKHLVIYKSTSFDAQPREVPEEIVVQAMRASSMFFDEDIRAFGKDIATTLPQLEDDQHLVIETSDTAIHVYVANNELQVVAFRDGQEVSRHASAIPAAAVKTELAAKAKPAPSPAVTSPPPPPVEAKPATPPPVTPPAPVADEPDKTKVATKQRPKNPPPAKPAKRMTEAEIRVKLDELDRLLAKQLITQAEYDQKKKALLDQL